MDFKKRERKRERRASLFLQKKIKEDWPLSANRLQMYFIISIVAVLIILDGDSRVVGSI